MSQTSGGEAGPPSAGVDSDGMSSSMTMEGPRSAFSTSSSSTKHCSSSATDQNQVHSGNADTEDNRRCRAIPEVLGAEGGSSNSNGGVHCLATSEVGGERGVAAQEDQPYQHMMPPKRRTELNISPPPQDLLSDSRMSCQAESTLDSEHSNSIWMDDSLSNFSIMSTTSYNDNTEVPRKSRKRTPRQRPGPKSMPASEASMDIFDADSAKGPHFVLSQLGTDNKSGQKGSSQEAPQTPHQKGGVLSMQYPPKSEGKELKILIQPESQHRARYLTEGSRGSVKDRTQQSFPTIKLEGVNEHVVLQVFVGNDAGRVKPHGFYQACRVTGRNTTACKEVDIGGTTVIEVPLDPSTNMTLAVDCVGILKLRNADVEARIGVAGSKKKSTRARLVFRVNIPRQDGSVLTLQTPSSSILCTQPAGVPEILKKSLHSCSVRGGEEVFIIGKNFLKDAKVIFQENVSDEKSWKAEAEIDMELFHQNHLIVKVPPYQNQAITSAVCVGIYVVTNAGRSHDVQPFTYNPDSANNEIFVKKEISSPVKCPFDDQVLNSTLMPPLLPQVKKEEVTPMEVTNNLQSSGVLKRQTLDLCPAQQNPDRPTGHQNKSREFSNTMIQPASDSDKSQAPVFSNTEPLTAIQKQDQATSSFSVPADSILLQGSQQFLIQPTVGLGQESQVGSSGPVGGLCGDPAPQQQQLSMFPSEGVAQLEEAVRHLKPQGFYMTNQQQHIQHQQIQNQQIQQQQIQQQQQRIQQQQQALENLQQQIFQSQIQIQHMSVEQQGSSPGAVPNQGSLFQQTQQQQQQQHAALFQQTNELLSIQTNFLQQTPSQPSPPAFHNPNPLAKAQDAQGGLFHSQKASHTQEQVQAALFQNNMTVLQSPDQQPSPPSLFLPQSSLSSQLTNSSSQQQQQLAFLNALQTPAPEQQTVFQPPTQLSPIQQGVPMDQQQPSQTQPLSQTTQQQTLFQNISQQPAANTLSAGQQQQPQAGLLFCNPLSTTDQASSILFSNQGQIPPLTSSSVVSPEPQNPSLLFSKAGMATGNQQDRSEPMALSNPNDTRQQVLFQDQQPMQLGTTISNRQEQSVGLFMPQPNMTSLQDELVVQELAQSAMFGSQNGVANLQTTTSSPVQQPGTLFQSTVSGSVSQPSQPQQPELFLFGIPNECGHLMNAPGNTLSDQIIAISQSGQNQRESEARIQSLLSQSLSQSVTGQSSMSASQNIEKIDDLLVSCLQEPGSSLTRSY
ncbi:nuclear factor of activated T-cells 5 isoform X2 [Dunckerocampus dactyliophorus]|nr:nuclear factor of activated T-cells 5 isoform X2 [Dunckerocampus dactyliophorus]XP_054626939.1 nuclear factor of activated T-cells 5 isoform X2 [Dunckerocampus dactyliophorus]XP_054626940.1 nuclear factor of activated T-cells 5 isoform X2 [Dunckerocampus dactyliophorus]XP_054626941.1 nuclear factor of activated T-cells 5 isoform X2 [Dunckerocampus dactyliophorus]XP_054626943.1 nuclear factor of activated T-cells 5 isoform X2 [Dunckerocampus dactyliophorus]